MAILDRTIQTIRLQIGPQKRAYVDRTDQLPSGNSEAPQKGVRGNDETTHLGAKNMGHTWGTTRGDSLAANRRQNKSL